ncbi:hypothetical protein LCGC14_0586390 [marine sediment metagenome]|uniref:Uncharacterized protein n=1 Tax=marine sediment metagenome TaxID=412755 RepID=A0A0F9UN50_9ZZZZ
MSGTTYPPWGSIHDSKSAGWQWEPVTPPARPDSSCIHCDEQLTPEEMSLDNKTRYTCYNCWMSGKRNTVVKQPVELKPDTLAHHYYSTKLPKGF